MSQDQTLFGCFLAKTDQDQHLKFSPQSHIFFLKVSFLTRNIVSPLGKNPWQELFKSPPSTHFFPDSLIFKIWD